MIRVGMTMMGTAKGIRRLWESSLGVYAPPRGPTAAIDGDVTEAHDRKVLASVFKADVLISFVPDSARREAISVLISVSPMPYVGRSLGSWVVTQPEKAAELMYNAIRADTAFMRIQKSHN